MHVNISLANNIALYKDLSVDGIAAMLQVLDY